MRLFPWLPCALALSLVACGPASLGEEIPLTELCKPANDGKRVSVSGAFSADGFLTMCSTRGSTKTCSFKLRKDAETAEPTVSINLTVGDGESEIKELPKSFKESDIQIKTVGGKVVGDKAMIKVTGKALIGEACQLIDVNRIDAL